MSLLDKEDIIDDEANKELLIQYLTNNGWFKVNISDVSLEGVFYEKKFLSHVVKLRVSVPGSSVSEVTFQTQRTQQLTFCPWYSA